MPENCPTYLVALSPGVLCRADVMNWICLIKTLGCWESDKTFSRTPARLWWPRARRSTQVHNSHDQAHCGVLLRSVRTRTDARLLSKMGLRQFLVRTKNWGRRKQKTCRKEIMLKGEYRVLLSACLLLPTNGLKPTQEG